MMKSITLYLRRRFPWLVATQIVADGQNESILRVSLITTAGMSFLIRIVSTGLIFTTSVLLARVLGAEEYGVYAYVTSWITILSVVSLMGLSTLLTREVARYMALSDWQSLRGVVIWSVKTVVPGALTIGMAAIVGLQFFLREGQSSVESALMVGIALLLLLPLIRITEGILQGLGRVIFGQLPWAVVLNFVFLLFVGMAYVFSPTQKLSAVTALVLRFGGALIALLVGLGLLLRLLPEPVKSTSSKYHVRKWRRMMSRFLLIDIAQAFSGQVSLIIVGSLLGSREAGIYDAASKFSILIVFVLMAANLTVSPSISSLYAHGNRTQLQYIATKSARVILLASILIALGIIVTRQWLLLLFGRAFLDGTRVLVILSIGQVLRSAGGVAVPLLSMTHYEDYAVLGLWMAGIINFVFALFLVPSMGIEGAAAAQAIGLLSEGLLLAGLTYRNLQINSTAF